MKKTFSKDGGWGWIVCLSCFAGHLIIGGIKRSYGLALPLLKTYFETNTALISCVASILEGMYYIVGPIVSMVANKIGLSPTCIIGSILTFFGLPYNKKIESASVHWILATEVKIGAEKYPAQLCILALELTYEA